MNADSLSVLLERIEAAIGPDRMLDMDIALATRTGSFNEQIYDGCSKAMKMQTIAFSVENAEFLDCEECGGERVSRGFTSVPEATAKIDVGNALVKHVLPEWGLVIDFRKARCWLRSPDDVIPFLPDLPTYTVRADGPTPELALCAALLKAMIVREAKP